MHAVMRDDIKTICMNLQDVCRDSEADVVTLQLGEDSIPIPSVLNPELQSFVTTTTTADGTHTPSVEIHVQHAQEFTAVDVHKSTPGDGDEGDDEYGFTAKVLVKGHVTFHRAMSSMCTICLVVHEFNFNFCPKEHTHAIATVPTTIPFELKLSMGIATYSLQVSVPTVPFNGMAFNSFNSFNSSIFNSSIFLVDVVPGNSWHVKRAPNPPFPFPMSIDQSPRLQTISVLLFDATTIGGQQILDLVKSRVLGLESTLDMHFLAEPVLPLLPLSDNRSNASASFYGPLIQHYYSLRPHISLHLLIDLIGLEMASRFMSEKLNVLRHVVRWEALDDPLKTALYPLLVLLQQMDVVSLPNSIRAPTLFNMLHMARLANVKARVVELANIRNEQDTIESATMFVGPSTYVCAHRMITRFSIPCVVIHPVGIAPLNRTQKEIVLPRQSSSGKIETITFAAVSRVDSASSLGLFVRAAVRAAWALHNEGAEARIEILFVGKIFDLMRKTLRSYLSAVREEYQPSFRFVGQVKYEDVSQMLRDANVDVLVNPRLLETFGIAIVESMAMGIPVIACRGGGHSDVIQSEKDGLLVDCWNTPKKKGRAVVALAAAMLKLVHDRELRQALGRQGIVTATTLFSTQVLREKYTALYHGLSGREGDNMTTLATRHSQGHSPDEVHTAGLKAYTKGQYSEAERLIRRAIALSPSNFNFHNTLGEILRQKKDYSNAVKEYTQALAVTDGLNTNTDLVALVWINLGKTYTEQKQHELGQNAFEQALILHAQNNEARFRLSYTLQVTGQLNAAYDSYKQLLQALNTEELNTPEGLDTLLNMGTIEMLRGHFENGMQLYKQVLVLDPNNAMVLNNIGANADELQDTDTAMVYLKRAIALNPLDYAPHINIGSLCYKNGDTACALQSYEKALQLGGYPALTVRVATLMVPIMGTWDTIDTVRSVFQYQMTSIHAEWQQDGIQIRNDPIKAVQWLHFYLLYHGLSEYNNQVMMATFYTGVVQDLYWAAPHLTHLAVAQNTLDQVNDEPMDPTQRHPLHPKKIKIGFMSKYFGQGQPHGLLLEGIIAHLPRHIYHVIVFEVPGSKSTLMPELLSTADQVVQLQLVLSSVQRTLASHRLDVLVLADGMSEPVNYFVALGTRVAPVQCMFWGNPVTIGGSNIDYFISGDRMETLEGWKEYSEQLIRLEGQAIWYNKIVVPPPESQTFFNIENIETEERNTWEWEWQKPNTVVYVCPQSTYKIHPDFIATINVILHSVPHGHLIMIKGRKRRWTDLLQNQLKSALFPHVYSRIHFVPRMHHEAFLHLIRRADVMLHPFPFGGSKTSADGIAMGIPVVCLKTQHLRGRMAYSFFVTMEYEVTVATCSAMYVEIAVKLGRDVHFRKNVSTEIRARSGVIWERHEYVDSWDRFLQRAVKMLV